MAELTFGEKVLFARKQLDLYQYEMAERLGVHANSITKYERGEGKPHAAVVRTDAFATSTVRSNQPDLPARFVVFQIVMFGAALLAAVPNKWVLFIRCVLLLAGMFISGFSVASALSKTD